MSHRPIYRLYGFVPYQLSGIQAGIQFGHATVEFMKKFYSTKLNNKIYDNTEDIVLDALAPIQWAEIDKTFIVLNGGSLSHIQVLYEEFTEMFPNRQVAEFIEPDLGNMISSFVFLVSDEEYDYYNKYKDVSSSDIPPVPKMRTFLNRFFLFGSI